MSNRSCAAVLGVTLLLLSSVALAAHHSITGQFDMAKSVMLTGTIAKVDWINPHAYVYFDVKSATGSVTTWALSTVPLPMLRKAGLTKDALAGKVGEVVTITVKPALDTKKHLGWITRITYADGHYYLLSSQ